MNEKERKMNERERKNDADKAIEVLKANGEDAVIIGEVVEGNDGVVIE